MPISQELVIEFDYFKALKVSKQLPSTFGTIRLAYFVHFCTIQIYSSTIFNMSFF